MRESLATEMLLIALVVILVLLIGVVVVSKAWGAECLRDTFSIGRHECSPFSSSAMHCWASLNGDCFSKSIVHGIYYDIKALVN